MRELVMTYFRGSFLVTFVGLVLGFLIGFTAGGVSAALKTTFIVAMLGVLETSLSFDNAVVNARVLVKMDEVWRRRFITWGIAIAVFGMRIVFPLVIVAVIAKMSPIAAFVMAMTEPSKYSEILISSHTTLMGFGGAFLLLVALKYFFDAEKDLHWIHVIEAPLSKLGKLEAVEIGVTLAVLAAIAGALPHHGMAFLMAGVAGIITFIVVDGIGAFFEEPDMPTQAAAKAGFSSFMYLEVLDASFSFDGVIGAFALSENILIIAIGLGIGAMFVRSLTLMLVDKGTLAKFVFLEHGAFFAIAALAVIMLLETVMVIPEMVTGFIAVVFIGLSVLSSIHYNRKNQAISETTQG